MLDELRNRLQPFIDQLQDRWQALPDDRQRLIRIGATSAAIILPLVMIVVPLLGGRLDAHQSIADAKSELEQMRALERRVLEHGLGDTGQGDQPVRRGRQASLIAVLDGIANKLEINNLIQAMRPIKSGRDEETEAVELQLKDLVLGELTALIYEIETSPQNLQIRRIEVQKELKDPNVLRAGIEVAR